MRFGYPENLAAKSTIHILCFYEHDLDNCIAKTHPVYTGRCLLSIAFYSMRKKDVFSSWEVKSLTQFPFCFFCLASLVWKCHTPGTGKVKSLVKRPTPFFARWRHYFTIIQFICKAFNKKYTSQGFSTVRYHWFW